MESRSTLHGWVKYMTKYPLLFTEATGRPYSKANIIKEACTLFSRHRDFGKLALAHNKPRKLLAGVEHIARHIGCSRDMVFRYIKRGMPTFMENGNRMAYEGRVERWARRNRAGRFAQAQ